MGFENQPDSKPEFQSNPALSTFAAATLTSPDTYKSSAGDQRASSDSALSSLDEKNASLSSGMLPEDRAMPGAADRAGGTASDVDLKTRGIDFNQHKLGELNEGFDYFKVGDGSQAPNRKDIGDPAQTPHQVPEKKADLKGNDETSTTTASLPDGDKLLSGLVESGAKEIANAATWFSPAKLFSKGEKPGTQTRADGANLKGAGTDTAGDGADATTSSKPKSPVSRAEQGAPHLEAQEKLFTDHWTKKPGADSAPRTHESTFTTGPTADHPNGMTYKNIQYDASGNVKSFETPGGLIQTRTSPPDAQGFANWKQTDKSGRLVQYSGAESSQWRDKISIDKETGVHHFIGSGKNAGAMFSRHPDGSLVESRPRVEGGKTRGMESTVELPDGSKVSRSSSWDGEKLVANTDSVRVQEPKARGNKDALAGNRDGAESRKDVNRPSGDKTEQLENKLEMLKPLMEPGSLDALGNVKDLSISRTRNPNEYAVSLDLKSPVTMPAPNMRIGGLGPFGGSSAVPRDSHVQNVDFNIRTTNTPGQLDVIGIRGVNGASDVYGPRGRHLMTKASSTESMRFDLNSRHPHVDVKSSGLNHALRLDSRHLGTDGMAGKLLNDRAFQQQVFDGIKALQNNLDSFKLSQKSPGNFEGSINPKVKEIALNQKVPLGETGFHAEVTKINFNEKGPVSFNLSNGKDGPELKFNKGDVTVGLKVGSIETKMDVSRIAAGKDKEGRPVAKIQFDGSPQEFEIPLYKKNK